MPIDRTTAPAPPRRPSPRQSSVANAAAAQTARQSQHDKRKEGVEGVGQALALVMLIRKQYADAQAIGMHFPAIAEETATICDSNDTLAKWVDWFSMSGPYAGLIKASLPLILQLMANHGTISADAGSALGVVSPKTLELAGKAEQKKVEAALMLQIQQTEAETARVMAQVNGGARNVASV